jgi:WD40 repeat protein
MNDGPDPAPVVGPLMTLEGHEGEVRCVEVFERGRRALTGGADRMVKIWDLGTGALLRTLDSHGSEVTRVLAMEDGRHALSSSAGGAINLWDLHTGELLRVFYDNSWGLNEMAVYAEEQRLLAASDDHTLKI